MIGRLSILTAALGCFFAASAAPANIKVTAEADSAVIVMGDRLNLRVVVDVPAGSENAVNLSELPLLTPGQDYMPWNGVDIVAVDSTSSLSDGRRRISYNYTVQAFDPGTLTLPPFKVTSGAGADTAFSNVLTLKVLPVEVDSLQQLNPMASIVAPATKWYDYIPSWLGWVLLGLAVVAAGVAIFILQRRHKAVVEERRNPPLPPYELAVSRLTSLQSRNLADSGQEKEYYTELVDILRQYLHGRFGINAMEMTSTQIVRTLRSNADTRMTADDMRAVLSIADFVKFAKVRPLPDDNVRAYSRAREFVEKTKPVEEPAPAEGNAATQTPTQTRR